MRSAGVFETATTFRTVSLIQRFCVIYGLSKTRIMSTATTTLLITVTDKSPQEATDGARECRSFYGNRFIQWVGPVDNKDGTWAFHIWVKKNEAPTK